MTQSGETADTLAALEMEQERRRAVADPAYAPRLLGVTNRPESSLGRLVDHILDIGAGIEVGVAATKTFLGQLLAFYGLALAFAERRGGGEQAGGRLAEHVVVRRAAQRLGQLREVGGAGEGHGGEDFGGGGIVHGTGIFGGGRDPVPGDEVMK